MWNCNILKFALESSPFFPCRTTFHIGIIHEHLLFQHVSHMLYFDMGNNMAHCIGQVQQQGLKKHEFKRCDWTSS